MEWILIGFIFGMWIGSFIEAKKWRDKAKTPYIRMLSHGKLYNVVDAISYDELMKTVYRKETKKDDY